MLISGSGGDVDRLVAHQPVPAVDGAVGRAQVADEDLPVAEVDGGVELGDVGAIDLQIVELVPADAHREALEGRLELLVGLGVEHLGHERQRHEGEPSRPNCRFGRRATPRADRIVVRGGLHGGRPIPHDEPGSEDPPHGLGPGVRLRRRHGRARVDALVDEDGRRAALHREAAPAPRAPVAAAPPPVTSSGERHRRGRVASELYRLREVAKRELRKDGESCDIDRPTYSTAAALRVAPRPRDHRHRRSGPGRRRGALQAPAPRPARSRSPGGPSSTCASSPAPIAAAACSRPG